ncbi:SDR family NAD(P)-dependent oxidoreductase [Mycobacterium tuberculosis]|nr:SDR family NAD(P)-dependent oxidoreductase [Mycobacterium tuberculosis]
MSGRLIGKVALVSGGARGMGASHVRAMVAEGAKVVFGDILDEEGKAVAAELADAARYVHLDVTQPAQWTAAVDTAVTAFGGLHVLVNNAGILNIGTIEDYALTEWQRILDVNLTGVFLGIRAVVKPMKEAGRGSIINISSIEGLAGTVACHGYTATKFAVRGLTKSTALELGPSGIRVNSIHPGLVKTPMTDWVPEDIFQTALGRAAEPKSSAGPMFSTYGIASTLLGVLSVAAVVLGAMIWSAHRDDSGERTYLTRVMLTAAEWTAVLINMNADNIDASLQRLHDGTVGQLNTDFDAVVQPYRQVVEKLRTHSSGRIEAVAIDTVHRELDTQSGAARPVVTTKLPPFATRTDSVLLVATSVSENAGAKPQTVHWNLRLDVSDVDGKLMISRLESIR